MALKITFTDGRTSDGYGIYTTTIGSVGTMKNVWLLDSMESYLQNTGNATHISLTNDRDKVERLYPKSQVMCVE